MTKQDRLNQKQLDYLKRLEKRYGYIQDEEEETTLPLLSQMSTTEESLRQIQLQQEIDKANGKTNEAQLNAWDKFLVGTAEFKQSFDKGFLTVFEGIGDSILGLGATIGSAFGADTKGLQDFISRDLSGEFMSSDFVKNFNRYTSFLALQGTFSEEAWNKAFDKNIDVLPEIVANLTQGVGNGLGYAGLALATGGIGNALGASSSAIGVASTLGTFASAQGGGLQQALMEGYDLDQAQRYGIVSGAIETASEVFLGKVLGAVGLGVNKIAGVTKLGTGLSKSGTKVIADIFKGMNEEGIEEVVSSLVEPINRMLTLEEGNFSFKRYGDIFKENGGIEGLLQDYLGGAISSGVIGGGNTFINVKRSGGWKAYNIIYETQELRQINEEMARAMDKNDTTKINELKERKRNIDSRIQSKFKAYLDDMLELKNSKDTAIKDRMDFYINKGKTETESELLATRDINKKLDPYNYYIDNIDNSEDTIYRALTSNIEDRIGWSIEFSDELDSYIDYDANKITLSKKQESMQNIGKLLAHEWTHSISTKELTDALLSLVDTAELNALIKEKKSNTTFSRAIEKYKNQINEEIAEGAKAQKVRKKYYLEYIKGEVAADLMVKIMDGNTLTDFENMLNRLSKSNLKSFLSNLNIFSKDKPNANFRKLKELIRKSINETKDIKREGRDYNTTEENTDLKLVEEAEKIIKEYKMDISKKLSEQIEGIKNNTLDEKQRATAISNIKKNLSEWKNEIRLNNEVKEIEKYISSRKDKGMPVGTWWKDSYVYVRGENKKENPNLLAREKRLNKLIEETDAIKKKEQFAPMLKPMVDEIKNNPNFDMAYKLLITKQQAFNDLVEAVNGKFWKLKPIQIGFDGQIKENEDSKLIKAFQDKLESLNKTKEETAKPKEEVKKVEEVKEEVKEEVVEEDTTNKLDFTIEEIDDEDGGSKTIELTNDNGSEFEFDVATFEYLYKQYLGSISVEDPNGYDGKYTFLYNNGMTAEYTPKKGLTGYLKDNDLMLDSIVAISYKDSYFNQVSGDFVIYKKNGKWNVGLNTKGVLDSKVTEYYLSDGILRQNKVEQEVKKETKPKETKPKETKVTKEEVSVDGVSVEVEETKEDNRGRPKLPDSVKEAKKTLTQTEKKAESANEKIENKVAPIYTDLIFDEEFLKVFKADPLGYATYQAVKLTRREQRKAIRENDAKALRALKNNGGIDTKGIWKYMINTFRGLYADEGLYSRGVDNKKNAFIDSIENYVSYLTNHDKLTSNIATMLKEDYPKISDAMRGELISSIETRIITTIDNTIANILGKEDARLYREKRAMSMEIQEVARTSNAKTSEKNKALNLENEQLKTEHKFLIDAIRSSKAQLEFNLGQENNAISYAKKAAEKVKKTKAELDDITKNNKDLQEQINTLTAQKESLQAKIDDKKIQVDEATLKRNEKQITSLNEQISKLKDQNINLNNKYKDKRAELRKLQSEHNKLIKQRDSLNESLAKNNDIVDNWLKLKDKLGTTALNNLLLNEKGWFESQLDSIIELSRDVSRLKGVEEKQQAKIAKFTKDLQATKEALTIQQVANYTQKRIGKGFFGITEKFVKSVSEFLEIDTAELRKRDINAILKALGNEDVAGATRKFVNALEGIVVDEETGATFGDTYYLLDEESQYQFAEIINNLVGEYSDLVNNATLTNYGQLSNRLDRVTSKYKDKIAELKEAKREAIKKLKEKLKSEYNAKLKEVKDKAKAKFEEERKLKQEIITKYRKDNISLKRELRENSKLAQDVIDILEDDQIRLERENKSLLHKLDIAETNQKAGYKGRESYYNVVDALYKKLQRAFGFTKDNLNSLSDLEAKEMFDAIVEGDKERAALIIDVFHEDIIKRFANTKEGKGLLKKDEKKVYKVKKKDKDGNFVKDENGNVVIEEKEVILKGFNQYTINEVYQEYKDKVFKFIDNRSKTDLQKAIDTIDVLRDRIIEIRGRQSLKDAIVSFKNKLSKVKKTFRLGDNGINLANINRIVGEVNGKKVTDMFKGFYESLQLLDTKDGEKTFNIKELDQMQDFIKKHIEPVFSTLKDNDAIKDLGVKIRQDTDTSLGYESLIDEINMATEVNADVVVTFKTLLGACEKFIKDISGAHTIETEDGKYNLTTKDVADLGQKSFITNVKNKLMNFGKDTIDLLSRFTTDPRVFFEYVFGFNKNDFAYKQIYGGLSNGRKNYQTTFIKFNDIKEEHIYKGAKLKDRMAIDKQLKRLAQGKDMLEVKFLDGEGKEQVIEMSYAQAMDLYGYTTDKHAKDAMAVKGIEVNNKTYLFVSQDAIKANAKIESIKEDFRNKLAKLRKERDTYKNDGDVEKQKAKQKEIDALKKEMEKDGAKFKEIETLQKTIDDQFYANINSITEQINNVLHLDTEGFYHDYFTYCRALFDHGKYLKRETDKKIIGYSNVLEDTYWRINVAKDKIEFDITDFTNGGMGALNPSFNISRKGYGTLKVGNVTQKMSNYTKEINLYSSYASPINTIQRMLSYKIDGVSLERLIEDRFDDKDKKVFITYLKELIRDIQGIKPKQSQVDKALGKATSWLRSNYVVSRLGLNLKVAVTQTASLGAATKYLDIKDITNGLFGRMATKYAGIKEPILMRYRRLSGAILNAETSGWFDKTGNFFTSWIQKMDNNAIRAIWWASIEQVKKKNNLKDYTQFNDVNSDIYKQAEELFTKTVNETQPNYDSLERSSLMRSRNAVFQILTMFKTQQSKMWSNIMECYLQVKSAKQGLGKVDTNLLKRTSMSVVLNGLVYTIMAYAINKMLDGDWDDEDDLEELTIDAINNTFISLIPLVSNILSVSKNGIQFNELTLGYLGGLNDLLTQVFNFQESSPKKMVDAIATILGVPTSNVYRTLKGMANFVIPNQMSDFNLAYTTKFGKTSSASKQSINYLLQDGKTGQARAYYKNYHSHIMPLKPKTENALFEIYKNGGSQSILKNVPTTLKVNGVEISVDKKLFVKTYSKVTNALDTILFNDKFNDLDNEQKEAIVSKLISLYYNLAVKEQKKKSFSFLENALFDGYELTIEDMLYLEELSDIQSTEVLNTINKIKATKGYKYFLYALCGYKLSDRDAKYAEGYLRKNIK